MGIYTNSTYLNEVKRKMKDGTQEDLDTGEVSRSSTQATDTGNDYNANDEEGDETPNDENDGSGDTENASDNDNSDSDKPAASDDVESSDEQPEGTDDGGDTGTGDDDTSDLEDTDYGDNDYTSDDAGDGGEESEDIDGDGETTDAEEDAANDTEEEKKDEIAEIEADIFKDLSPEQLNIKVTELKNKFLEVHTSISNAIIRLQSVSKTEENRKVVDFCITKLTELKELVYYYTTATFDTKSYVENNINLQQYISTLATIEKLLKGIIPKKEQKA